jgi:hypothetical protein
MTNHYQRCGKRVGDGIHTCTPNPVIEQLRNERDVLVEALEYAADALAPERPDGCSCPVCTALEMVKK